MRRARRRTGAAGETGAPGAPGTQISLETDAPGDEPCQADGDLYIYLNTDAAEFYECTDARVDAGLAGAHCGGCHTGADGGHQRLIARQPSPRFAASSSRQFAGTRSAGPGTDWVGGWLSGGAR